MSSPSRPRRRPGRPSESGLDLRARLLDVAAESIARHGWAGTTLRDIAHQARATPALVHYYFGSRERLLDALFDERILPTLGAATAAVREAAAGGALALEPLVRGYVGVMWANRWLPPLLAREVLSEGGVLRERFLSRLAGPLLGTVPAIVARAQAEGHLRRDLDPALVVLSLLSLLVFPLIAAPVWTRALPVATGSDLPERLIRHTLAVLRHGVERSDA